MLIQSAYQKLSRKEWLRHSDSDYTPQKTEERTPPSCRYRFDPAEDDVLFIFSQIADIQSQVDDIEKPEDGGMKRISFFHLPEIRSIIQKTLYYTLGNIVEGKYFQPGIPDSVIILIEGPVVQFHSFLPGNSPVSVRVCS